MSPDNLIIIAFSNSKWPFAYVYDMSIFLNCFGSTMLPLVKNKYVNVAILDQIFSLFSNVPLT